MEVILKIRTGKNETEYTLPLSESFIFGRSKKSSFKIKDPRMSARHCELIFTYNRLEIHDLNSKNGTYLNGIRIEHSEIFAGDMVKIGDSVLSISENNSPKILELLSFPGSHKDRLAYELKADFTTVRNFNQSAKTFLPHEITSGHRREIEIRQKAQTKIRLSKAEIRSKNKVRAFASILLDSTAMLMLLYFVVLAFNRLFPTSAGVYKSNVILMSIIVSAIAFFILNFKVFPFSFGEILSGIKRRYYEQ